MYAEAPTSLAAGLAPRIGCEKMMDGLDAWTYVGAASPSTLVETNARGKMVRPTKKPRVK